MIERETYVELIHSMLYALVREQLGLPQVASILHACAQPDTNEEVNDVTIPIRDALTDWSEENKGQIVAVEIVKITFNCSGYVHGACEKGHHTVALTRIIGSTGWSPDDVASSVDFNQTIMEATQAAHPDGPGGKYVASKKSRGDSLITAFKELFALGGNEQIESEVKDFRAELDALFPSAPTTQEKGGSDDSP